LRPMLMMPSAGARIWRQGANWPQSALAPQKQSVWC
jgi:hypothetical protein